MGRKNKFRGISGKAYFSSNAISRLQRKQIAGYFINVLNHFGNDLSDELIEHCAECCFSKAECAELGFGSDDDSQPELTPSEQQRIIRERLDLVRSWRHRSGDSLAMRLNQLQQTFDLSEDEKQLIAFVHLKESYRFLDRLVDLVQEEYSYNHPQIATKVVPIILGWKEQRLTTLLTEKSKFRRFDIVADDLDLDDSIDKYLAGTSESALSNGSFRKYDSTPLSIDCFSSFSKDIPILADLVRKRDDKPISILLYGKPGTGKTSFVRSFASHIGSDLYEVIDDEESRRASSRFRSLYVCERMIASTSAVLCIDEADGMLNSIESSFFGKTVDHTAKQKINDTLDSASHIQFWITNRHRGIDESTLRRFDYTIQFDTLGTEQRLGIWRNVAVECSAILTEDQFTILAKQYEVSPGIMTKALQNAVRMEGNSPATKTITHFLDNLMRVQGKDSEAKGSLVSKNYSLKALNISGDIESVVEQAQEFTRTIRDGEELIIPNLPILLTGAPGTGKTALARYLADQCCVPLIETSAGDFLDKYVGGTEENIRRLFKRAIDEKAILFIDEADSILSTRKGAGHSWEITQVNEILTQMEKFTGVMICATNFHEKIDSAAIRRFVYKLHFDFLTPKGMVELYNSYFGECSEDATRRISSICNGTPGDFWTVYRQFSLLSSTRKELFDPALQLLEESRLKEDVGSRVMGFR